MDEDTTGTLDEGIGTLEVLYPGTLEEGAGTEEVFPL